MTSTLHLICCLSGTLTGNAPTQYSLAATHSFQQHPPAGLLKAAVADYSAVLGAVPGHIEAAYARGAARHKLGAIEEAIADFTTVLEADPGHVRAAYGRAACYNLAGRFDDANGMWLTQQSFLLISLTCRCLLACDQPAHL